MPNYDFLLEHRLKELNSELAYRHTSCMSLFEQMLKKFLAVFPTFTDHTLLHTLSVANISNQLLRENVRKLNASEIYIYLMACALHDIGMGVSDKDIDSFIDASGLRGYVNDHPEISKPNLIRKFHNDFSSQFVKKYWELFEVPSEQYANAIAEVGRGHRKTDLMDDHADWNFPRNHPATFPKVFVTEDQIPLKKVFAPFQADLMPFQACRNRSANHDLTFA